MKKNDLEIGPCWTDTAYRGQGVYSNVLKLILIKFNKEYDRFYIFTDEDNPASQKGIQKAEFKKFGRGTKNRFGKYVVIKP